MKNIVLVILLILTCTFLSFAGTTGKVAGKITDSETGEGLPGANIVIDGTTLGAATDANGNFTILNIPPGLYILKLTFIGYQSLKINDVRVNVDFTTRIDQVLSPSTLELAEVEVYAERNPLVRQDLTNTLVALTSERIDELPVDQIRDVIALTAGVVEDNTGGLHIRGGRSNEVAYQVNGLGINNPFSNGQAVGLATNAVEEVSVSTGTFSAEYGNALSGVVNFVTKDGGPDYHGSLKVWSGDHVSSRDDIFFNIDDRDVFNNQRIEWTGSGPVPLFNNKLTFFTSGVLQKDDGYLYGIDLYRPSDWVFYDFNDQPIVIDPFGFPATLADTSGNPGADGSGDIVPMVTRESFNFTGKLTWKPSSTIKLSYDLIFDNGKRHTRTTRGISNFRRWRFTPSGRPKVWSNNQSHSFGLTHAINNKTFYTLKFGLNYTRRREAAYEDTFDSRYFPLQANDISNHFIQPTGTYVAGGNDLYRSLDKSRTFLAKVDVISQVVSNHEIKLGAEFKQHRLEAEAYDLLFDFNSGQLIIPFPELNPDFTDYQSYDHKPVQAAFYILDKMELAKKFILNVGLRYEYLDAKALYNPNLAGTVDQGVGSPELLKSAESKHSISPRVSLSFPITAEGIIRFSYGYFYQNPTFNQIYRNARFEDFDFIRTPTFGNTNLEPERSIQYEMGLQQQFTDNFKADLTIFYKDVNNLIQRRRVLAGDVALEKEFNVVTNISYASVKGFTASLLKRRSPGGLFSASLDYTLQVGEGAFTDPTALAADTRTGRLAEQQLVPLSFDRTHVLNATFSLTKGRSWSASSIASLQSGTPFTPSVPSSIQETKFQVNSARRPTILNVDVKVEKFYQIAGTTVSFFMQIENALDRKNERLLHTNTGSSLNNLAETTNAGLFDNLREVISNDQGNFFPVQFLDDFYQREDWLSEPREIRMGMTFDF